MIDIGANLTHEAFRRDLDDVLGRAVEAGLRRVVVTGTSLAASRAALALAATRPGLLAATAGVHPHDAKTCDGTTLSGLRALAAQEAVVAVGECGLDFDRNFSPPAVQLEWFEKQVVLAGELALPLFLHERAAHSPLLEVLKAHRDDFGPGVVHCFTGSRDELDAYLGLDLHIGITGWICDERRGTGLREIVRRIPTDRLMIETDAPYLLPRTIRPRPRRGRNEPAFLASVRDSLADCLGRSPAEVGAATARTAERFFGLSGSSPT